MQQAIIRTGVGLLYQAIPDELQNDLIQIGENISRDKWRIGDITNRLKELTRERLLNCSIMDIYSFVAQLLRDEISARTVEYYAGLSAFYEPGIREEYQPLSHSHFAYARQFGDGWLEVLNLALDLMARSGKVPSVAMLDHHYMQRDSQVVMPEMSQLSDLEELPDGSDTVETDYVASVVNIPLQAAVMALEALQRVFVGLGKVEYAEKVKRAMELLLEIA